jgi:predicted ribosomally synthesized peptide with SipW-like signal peptide
MPPFRSNLFMLRSWRNSSTTLKLLSSLAVLGAAASIAGLGTYATFTSSTTASHSVSSGTLTVALGAVGAANRLTVSATGIAPGDTMQRAFDLSNTGSIDFAGAPTLTTTASPTSLLDTDATNGVQMQIDKCSVAWTEAGTTPAYTYTCSGTTTAALASRAVIGSAIALSNLSDLTTAGTGPDHLKLTLTLPSGAGNTFQALSSTLTYSFNATQRAATNK